MYGRPIEDIIISSSAAAGKSYSDLPPPYIPANVRPITELPTGYAAVAGPAVAAA
jgi:hypothetical protein